MTSQTPKPASRSLTIWSVVGIVVTMILDWAARRYHWDLTEEARTEIRNLLVLSFSGSAIYGRVNAKRPIGKPADQDSGDQDPPDADPTTPPLSDGYTEEHRRGLKGQFDPHGRTITEGRRWNQLAILLAPALLLAGCTTRAELAVTREAVWEGTATIRKEHLQWTAEKLAEGKLRPDDAVLRQKAHLEVETYVKESRSRDGDGWGLFKPDANP